MKKFSLSVSAVTAIVGLTLLSGCGSSGFNSDSSVEAQALGAYISGGNAFIDCNKNGVKDAGELSATTALNGMFEIKGKLCSDYNIVVEAGRNTATNARMIRPSMAPRGYSKVSALTTVLSAIPQADRAKFLQKLNLTDNDLRQDYNLKSDDNVAKSMAKIVAAKSFIETVLVTSTTKTEVYAVARSFSEAVMNQDRAIDFKNETSVEELQSEFVSIARSNSEITNVSIIEDNLVTQVENIVAIAQVDTVFKAKYIQEKVENDNAKITETLVKDPSKSLVTTEKVKIANIEIPLVNNVFAPKDITKGTNINDLYNASLQGVKVSKDFASQNNVTLSIEIANTANNENVKISIDKVQLAGTASGGITTTIPAGATVKVEETDLPTLEAAMGAKNVSKATLNQHVNTNLAINMNDVLNSLGNGTKIHNTINALNSYLSQNGTYTVRLSADGYDTSKVVIPNIRGTITVK